jgi:hypothetical protein
LVVGLRRRSKHLSTSTGQPPPDRAIGAIELINRSPTGQTFHRYLCPERFMPADALAVHGLTAEFLADKPLFGAVADEFLAFVGDAPLVAHNAGFDVAFLNAELKRAGKPPIATNGIDGRPVARWPSKLRADSPIGCISDCGVLDFWCAAWLRPCSGAFLILVFALAQGLFPLGVAATLVMGLGSAITMAAIATFAVSAKGLAASPQLLPHCIERANAIVAKA